MNIRTYPGFIASFFVGTLLLFIVHTQLAFAADLVLYSNTLTCRPCRTLDTWLTSDAGKAVVGKIPGGLPPQSTFPPDGEGIPALFKDGQRIGTGPQEIQEAIQAQASQNDKQESLAVDTKYKYVGPGLGVTGPALELVPHGRPIAPGYPLSDDKQEVLAINVGTGRGSVVELGGVLVASGVYRVGPACQDNRAPGSPSKIVLPKLDENAFKACPTQGTTTPSSSGFGNVGGGAGGNLAGGAGGLGGGLGGAGGLQSLLPALLMQSLLGGMGQQGQQAQNNQNPYGAGYGQQASCASQGASPVCGTDGKTYTNQCYMQQMGATLQNIGMCSVAATATPVPARTLILNQLENSGVPLHLLNNVRSTVSSLLSSARGGLTNVPETVIK